MSKAKDEANLNLQIEELRDRMRMLRKILFVFDFKFSRYLILRCSQKMTGRQMWMFWNQIKILIKMILSD